MKTTTFALAMAAAFGLLLATQAEAANRGDAALGAKAFGARCALCHGKEATGGPMAPSLLGVWGRKAGSATFTRYSPALKASGLSWTAANLDTYIAGPQKMVPGTQMMASLPNAADRQNVVAYLSTLRR